VSAAAELAEHVDELARERSARVVDASQSSDVRHSTVGCCHRTMRCRSSTKRTSGRQHWSSDASCELEAVSDERGLNTRVSWVLHVTPAPKLRSVARLQHEPPLMAIEVACVALGTPACAAAVA
jgi:hypothetical protein